MATISGMADSERTDDVIKELQALCLSQHSDSSVHLNSRLRKGLQSFASTHGYKFSQDNIGNLYITRAGSDPTLSSIALSFPVDSSTPSFSSALRTFLQLRESSHSCDISLLGWSSPGGSDIGRDVWEGLCSRSAGYEQAPELKEFSGMEDVSIFPQAAIFDIIETESDPLVLQGSPVLTEAAKRAANKPVTVNAERWSSLRAPVLNIQGQEAVSMAKLAVEEYSRYVAALFENFN